MDKYMVVIQYDDKDKIYVASNPELPGCMAHGTTQAEALKELNVARELWLETAMDVGKEIPAPSLLRESV